MLNVKKFLVFYEFVFIAKVDTLELFLDDILNLKRDKMIIF